MTNLDLAPHLSPAEELANRVASIERADDPRQEYYERRDYLNSEVANGHITPQDAAEAMLTVPNEFQIGLIRQIYVDKLRQNHLDDSMLDESQKRSARSAARGQYGRDIMGQFQLLLVPDADDDGSPTPVDPGQNPTVINDAPDAQGDREPKASLRERIGNLRPIKALKAAKTAYAVKARAQRELNSINPDSPTYDANAHEAAKAFAAEKSAEYRIARKRAIGGTALAGAVVGTVVAMSDKLSIPFGSNESWQEGKNLLALGAAGALAAAGSLWREKRKISEDQRKDLLDWKRAEIDNYEQAQSEDHDFDNDEYYQDLWDEADTLTPASLKDRISTKWAEWGTYSGAVGVNNLDRLVQWAKNKATKAEPMLSWDQIESDIMSRLPEEDQDIIQENIHIVENYQFDPTSVDEDAYLKAQRKLNGAQKVISAQFAHEYASTEGRRWGKAALVVGGLALTALAVKYAPHIDMPDLPDMPWGGNKGNNKGGSVTEHLTPKRLDTYNKLDTGSKGQLNEFMPTGSGQNSNPANIMLDAAKEISQVHKVDIGSTEFNKIAENTFKLAAKKEEFLGNSTGANRIELSNQFDANFQAWVEHMKKVEEAAQAAN